MAFIPHTAKERRQMLEVVGAGNMEELFRDIPADARFPKLRLPPPMSEMELDREIRKIVHRNRALTSGPSFLGAGCYRHFIPATVDYVLQRGEFYTSYTPYQPELSQGVLQAMFEYQSMICQLTGMEVSNASHYDGATSLAEAILLSLDTAKGSRNKVLVSPYLNPRYQAVAQTYLQGTDARIDMPELPVADVKALAACVDEDTAALVVQSPNFLGGLEDLSGVADIVHANGALLVVVADPIALGLFKPPGDLGADVVVADGQPLGIAPSFGGPSLGIFATRRAHVRRLVGRLVAQTEDHEGRRGFVLTLATREQHIRRERATSNICTNSGLGALSAAVYLASMGERGLRQVAELCFHKSHYAAARIAELPGCMVNAHAPNSEFFKEFVVSLPCDAGRVITRLREEHDIVAGYDLSCDYPEWDNSMLVAVTEMNTREEIDRLVAALHQVIARTRGGPLR